MNGHHFLYHAIYTLFSEFSIHIEHCEQSICALLYHELVYSNNLAISLGRHAKMVLNITVMVMMMIMYLCDNNNNVGSFRSQQMIYVQMFIA